MVKVNVYGTGANAVKFVLENRDIQINTFVEGRNNRTHFMKELLGDGGSVIRIEDAHDTLKQYYTVVASLPNVYWEIKERLEKEHDLVEFEDFCYFEIFRKKIAVIYGNCHTTPIKEGLQLSREFNSVYGFYPLKPICTMVEQGTGLNTMAFERCDLFIHQCIWDKNVYGIEYASSTIMRRLKQTCKQIGIPNVYRMPHFLFPQMKSYEGIVCWAGYNYFPFRDFYIENNYKNLSISELADMIRDDTLIDASDILNAMEMFFEKLIVREVGWDIKISDFLRNNLSNKHLFYDPNHPTNEVIAYIIREILKVLQIKGEDLDLSHLIALDTYELPIYESVYKALKLEYHIDFIRMHSRHYLNNCQMGLEEYIKQYIEWNHPI